MAAARSVLRSVFMPAALCAAGAAVIGFQINTHAERQRVRQITVQEDNFRYAERAAGIAERFTGDGSLTVRFMEELLRADDPDWEHTRTLRSTLGLESDVRIVACPFESPVAAQHFHTDIYGSVLFVDPALAQEPAALIAVCAYIKEHDHVKEKGRTTAFLRNEKKNSFFSAHTTDLGNAFVMAENKKPAGIYGTPYLQDIAP